jgi:hypothetical protein
MITEYPVQIYAAEQDTPEIDLSDFDYSTFRERFRQICIEAGIDPKYGPTGADVALWKARLAEKWQCYEPGSLSAWCRSMGLGLVPYGTNPRQTESAAIGWVERWARFEGRDWDYRE